MEEPRLHFEGGPDVPEPGETLGTASPPARIATSSIRTCSACRSNGRR